MSPRNREVKQTKRQNPSLLNDVLEHRMLLYVLAAGATLAGASPAQAKVVFTPSNAILNLGYKNTSTLLQIDLNNDGTIDFVLTDFFGGTSEVVSSSKKLFVSGSEPSNKILASSRSGGYFAAALKRGTPIGSGGKFGLVEHMANRFKEFSGGGSGSGGNFLNVTNRFLGVRFMINGRPHYGWIGFRSVAYFEAKLAGWAYETEPNKAILAGAMGEQDTESDSATMHSAERTTLELLAAGNVAIDDWRRRVAN
jgi:hypothetical protein